MVRNTAPVRGCRKAGKDRRGRRCGHEGGTDAGEEGQGVGGKRLAMTRWRRRTQDPGECDWRGGGNGCETEWWGGGTVRDQRMSI